MSTKKAKVMMLPVSKMFTEAYQREVAGVTVRRNARNYDALLDRIIEVAAVDGRYAVLDGQHRVEVARERKVRQLQCRVHTGLTYEQRAMYFKRLNADVIRPTPMNLFDADVEAGVPDAVHLKKLVESVGFKIERGSGVTNINAIYRLKQMYSLNPDLVPDAIVIASKRSRLDGRTLPGDYLSGVHAFMHAHGSSLNIKRLEKVLLGKPVEWWQGQSKRGESKENNVRTVARTIESQYNNNLSKENKLYAETYATTGAKA